MDDKEKISDNEEDSLEKESFFKKAKDKLKDAFSGFSEKDMIDNDDSTVEPLELNDEELLKSTEETSNETTPIEINDDEGFFPNKDETLSVETIEKENTESEKVKTEEDIKREKKLFKILMFLFMWIVILFVDIAAILGIFGNIDELKELEDTEIGYYLAIMDLFANILEIAFTVSLILPGTKKKRYIRYQRRISYFLNMLIGFAVSLLITNLKEFYPYINDEAYIKSHIPVLVMLGILLLIVVYAKLKIEAKTSRTKELVIYLYIFSGVIVIYELLNLFTGHTDIEEILHLLMAVFSFAFIYCYQKVAPKKFMDKRHAWLYDYGNGTLLVYSKAIVNVAPVKVTAVFSSIFCIGMVIFFILNFGINQEFKTEFQNLTQAREFSDIFGLGFAISIIALFLAFICICRFISCLKQNNAKSIMVGQFYVGFLTASSIFFCQSSPKGFSDFIDGQLPFAMYLTIAMIPFLFIKAAMDQHDVKPFESCTGPLEWGTLFSMVVMTLTMIGSTNYAYVLGIISLLFNYAFLINVKKHGFLEYEKPDKKDIDGKIGQIRA